MPLINVNHARHFYRLEGDPALPALVLVHPVGADLSLWDQVVPPLLNKFQVLRYDLRGHGASEATAGEYSLALLADDLLALASAAGLATFAVCGVSVGGMAAVQAAAKAPERVTALVLCSTATHLHPPPGGWDGRARSALDQGMEGLADPMVQRMVSAAHRASGDPAIHTLRTVFARMDPQGYAGTCAVLRDTDLEPLLPAISARTLVISGEHDALVAPAVGASMAGKIPGAQHLVLACGHFPPLEVPAVFAASIAEFCLARQEVLPQ